jgi:phosphoglycolate phosphatase
MYQAILFDLDGTITDSKEGIINSILYALSKFNMKEDPRKLEAFIGPPLYRSFQEYYGFDEEKAWQGVAFYREYFSEKGIYENAVYPGIPQLLSELQEWGKTLVLATAKPAPYAERILEHFKLRNYFTWIFGSNMDGTRALKDEVIRDILLELQDVPKDKVIMVGDRNHDILGANANGIASIGVTYGYGSLNELKESGADYLAASVEELRDILLSI